MAILEQELLSILRIKFPNSQIKLKDTVGDGDHYYLEISDPSFKALSLMAQHKLVNEALSDVLHTRLHSISIKTMA